jgi:hypothetical protein
VNLFNLSPNWNLENQLVIVSQRRAQRKTPLIESVQKKKRVKKPVAPSKKAIAVEDLYAACLVIYNKAVKGET